MTALYVLTGQYRQLAEQLAGGDFDAQTIADTIDASGIVDDINTKAQGVAMVARSAVQFIPAIEAEIERLHELKARNQRAHDALMTYLKTNMEAAQISEIKTPLFTLKIVNNPPAVDILNAVGIPEEYMSEQKPAPPRTPDKAKIGKALKAGEPLSWAALTQSTRLKVS
jgi:hypothetical protein